MMFDHIPRWYAVLCAQGTDTILKAGEDVLLLFLIFFIFKDYTPLLLVSASRIVKNESIEGEYIQGAGEFNHSS